MSEKPWFVRIRTPYSYQIEPRTREGWIASGIYIGAVPLAWLLRPYLGLGRLEWIIAGIMFTAWTIGFLVLVARTSVPENKRD
jgi:hypothetical protein